MRGLREHLQLQQLGGLIEESVIADEGDRLLGAGMSSWTAAKCTLSNPRRAKASAKRSAVCTNAWLTSMMANA